MAHLWVKDETDQWAVFQLITDEFALDKLTPGSLARVERAAVAWLMRTRQEGTDQWQLLAAPAARVRVNGLPLLTGLRTLRDHDQISIAETSAYFSTEARARCVAFPGAERKFFCARCRQELLDGAAAVQCPQCGVWHHQTDELPCWNYAVHCGLCSQPTDFGAGYRWQPED